MRLIEYVIINNTRNFGSGKTPMKNFELTVKISDLKINNEIELLEMFDFAKAR